MSHLSIEQIHQKKMGKVSDKWSSYLPFYDELFEKYRTQNLNLLEIAVQNGGSLGTWKIFLVMLIYSLVTISISNLLIYATDICKLKIVK